MNRNDAAFMEGVDAAMDYVDDIPPYDKEHNPEEYEAWCAGYDSIGG